MIAIDTNVLLRVFVKDDELQHAASKRLIGKAAKNHEQVFVSLPVLCEMIWVLQARHKLGREHCADLLQSLLENALFVLDQAPVVRRALLRFREYRGGFSDSLIAEIAAGAGVARVYTNDKALLREAGFAKP